MRCQCGHLQFISASFLPGYYLICFLLHGINDKFTDYAERIEIIANGSLELSTLANRLLNSGRSFSSFAIASIRGQIKETLLQKVEIDFHFSLGLRRVDY